MPPRDCALGPHLRAWIDSRVRPEFSERDIPTDGAIPTRWAHLHIPDRRNEADAIAVATALVHGLAVVARNIQDFQGTVLVGSWRA